MVDIKQKTSDLCKLSLKEKWHEQGERNIFGDCPFCADANERTKDDGDGCEICLCPKEICGTHGEIGFIQELRRRYGGFLYQIGEINKKDLNHMIDLFKKHII